MSAHRCGWLTWPVNLMLHETLTQAVVLLAVAADTNTLLPDSVSKPLPARKPVIMTRAGLGWSIGTMCPASATCSHAKQLAPPQPGFTQCITCF